MRVQLKHRTNQYSRASPLHRSDAMLLLLTLKVKTAHTRLHSDMPNGNEVTDLWFVKLATLQRLTRRLFGGKLCLSSERARLLMHWQSQPLTSLSNQTSFDCVDCSKETHQTISQPVNQ